MAWAEEVSEMAHIQAVWEKEEKMNSIDSDALFIIPKEEMAAVNKIRV